MTPDVFADTFAPTTAGNVDQYDLDLTTTSAFAVDATVGWLRDVHRVLGEDLKGLHHRTQANAYSEYTAQKVRWDVPRLLEELGPTRGLGWADIAASVGVTVAAVRKWRHGGDATPENRRRLAELAALLDVLETSMISDPAQWLEVPLPLPPGYTIRPIDLYREGHVNALLDYAANRIATPEALMDEVETDWRESRRSDFEVYNASDGQKAIRLRSRS
jgi:transcriptional regulator with XRE-family HTH domain